MFRVLSRFILICGICGALAVGATLCAQSSSEVTPAVEQLYAEAQAAQRSGNSAAAIAKYRAILHAAPHLAPAYNNLGMLYFNARDYSDAVPVLEKGLQINPRMTTASTLLGLSYFELGENGKAEPLLARAVHADPADKNVRMSYIHVLLGLGKTNDAVAQLREYLDRNPKDQEAWYLLGETYLHLSESALAKVNQINPDSYVAHEVAGEIDESMHNYGGAVTEFKKAVAEAPQEPGTHLRLGNVYWVMGRWPLAEEELRAELALAPNDCVARWKLADSILQANGSNDDALDNLNQSIGRCPNLMQARVDRARTLIKLGKQSEALPDLLMAEKASPDEPSIHFLLATVYRTEGKVDEAKRELGVYSQLLKQAGSAAVTRANEAAADQSAGR